MIKTPAGESGGKAMSRIYGNIGFRGLWNGLPIRIGMIGTLTAFQWLIYDSFKVCSSPFRIESLWFKTADNIIRSHWVYQPPEDIEMNRTKDRILLIRFCTKSADQRWKRRP